MQVDTKPPRQLLIALDAMDWGLLEKWSSEGKLPNFRRLIGACDAVDDKPEALRDLRERIIEGAHLRGRVCRWLMENQEWDLFFVVFSETHCVGHHFWRFVDPTHPRHNEPDTHGLADTMEQ